MIIHLVRSTSHIFTSLFGQRPILFCIVRLDVAKSSQFYFQITDMCIRSGHMECQVEYIDYPDESKDLFYVEKSRI